MKLRFTTDASLTLGVAEGRVVTIAHRKGDEEELADDIGRLFLAQGVAVKVERAKRATRPRGETR